MAWELRKPIGDSGWTIETLLEYTNARIADMELRNQQRFDAQSAASIARQTTASNRVSDMELRNQQRFEAQTMAVDAAITAQRAAIDAALSAAQQATAKAELSAERRFHDGNNVRAQQTELLARTMSRSEYEASSRRLDERVQELQVRLQDLAPHSEVAVAVGGLDTRVMEIMRRMEGFAPRDTVLAEYNLISKAVTEMGERITRSEGRDSGTHAGWGYLFAAITAIAALVTIYIALRH